MSKDFVIEARNVSKHYSLEPRYETFRDMLSQKTASVFNHLFHPSSVAIQPGLRVLDDVSFNIEKGSRVGLLGKNGAGKSTLLKILSRITSPSQGKITIRGQVSSLLEIGAGFHRDLTGEENIYLLGSLLGMKHREIKTKLPMILEYAETADYVNTPLKKYSSGMAARLAFAIAAHLNTDIMIVDEALAVSDTVFQKRCCEKMKALSKEGMTIIFVSHSLSMLQAVCTEAIFLEKGKIVHQGDFQNTLRRYLSGQSSNNAYNGILYEEGDAPVGSTVKRIELLNQDDSLVSTASTWKPMTIRTTFQTSENVRDGIVVVRINTLAGNNLFEYPSYLDQVFVQAEPGIFWVDCTFPELPLSEGHYRLQVKLLDAKRQVLCEADDILPFAVVANGVYDSDIHTYEEISPLFIKHVWQQGQTFSR